MNKLEEFIATRPFGFLVEADMPELIRLDRLFPCLVRCEMCRFTCAAQDVAHLIECVEACGDYVRDVSAPVGWEKRAAEWKPEAVHIPVVYPPSKSSTPRIRLVSDCRPVFDESQCGGVFDGHQVTSDADPGL
jgi:hypothetical protein